MEILERDVPAPKRDIPVSHRCIMNG
jgi:hypothetical protein